MRAEADVVVVGGGAAGMSAAATAAQAGASVVLLEAEPEPGGLFGLQPWALQDRLNLFGGLSGQGYTRSLSEALLRSGAEVHPGAAVWDVDRDLKVSFALGGKAHRIGSRRLVVATGSTDGVDPFPGWTLPGVTMLRDAMAMHCGRQAGPGLRPLIIGGGDAALTLAAEMMTAGAEAVTAVWGEPGTHASPNLMTRVRAAGVSLLPGHRVTEAQGDASVTRVSLAPPSASGSELVYVDVDMVILATHRVPDFRAASLLGVAAGYGEEMGGWIPKLDQSQRSSDERVFVAGDAGGVGSGAVAVYRGRLAGLSAAADLGFVHPEHDRIATEAAAGIELRKDAGRASAGQQMARDRRSQWHLLSDSVTVCRCTGATVGDIGAVIEPGGRSAAEIRRLSRAGMGWCQGRYCDEMVAEITAASAGISPHQVGMPRVRPPLHTIPLTALADIPADGET